MVRIPPCDGGDAGSIPAGHPKHPFLNQDMAQPGRARARGARGHGIEARFPDHFGEAVASLPPFEPTAVGYHTYHEV